MKPLAVRFSTEWKAVKFHPGAGRKYCLLLFAAAAAIAAFGQNDNSGRQLTLLFAGDIMGHGAQIKSAEVTPNELYDYTPCFRFVRPWIESADLAIGNLELTLPGKPPYTGYPQFRSPDELALALREAGFDLMVTANNHSNDGGKAGVLNTIKTLRQYKFLQTGTFADAEERAFLYPLLVYKNDFKLAFLNYTYGTNGLPTPAPCVVNLIDEKVIREDLELTKKLRPDFIIVIMHWGLEYQLNESEEQRALGKKLFDWGADLVIGAHPHVVQPIKKERFRKNDAEHEGLIAYSLGNFISNQTRPHTDGGIMVEVTLKKDIETGETKLIDSSFIPVWRHIQKTAGKKDIFMVLPVVDFEDGWEDDVKLKDPDLIAMKQFAKNVRAHLAKFQCAEKLPVHAETK